MTTAKPQLFCRSLVVDQTAEDEPGILAVDSDASFNTVMRNGRLVHIGRHNAAVSRGKHVDPDTVPVFDMHG